MVVAGKNPNSPTHFLLFQKLSVAFVQIKVNVKLLFIVILKKKAGNAVVASVS